MDPYGESGSDHAGNADEPGAATTQYQADHLNFTDVADINIAIAADHLRRTARTVQQLTAALSVHLALATNDIQAMDRQATSGTPRTSHPRPSQHAQISAATASHCLDAERAP